MISLFQISNLQTLQAVILIFNLVHSKAFYLPFLINPQKNWAKPIKPGFLRVGYEFDLKKRVFHNPRNFNIHVNFNECVTF